jgi:MFS family permease
MRFLLVIGLMTIGLAERLKGVLTRDALLCVFLLTSALVWYAYAIVFLEVSMRGLNLDFFSNMLAWGVHFGALIFSALLGATLSRAMGKRIRFLAIWIIVGTVSSLTPLIFNTAEAFGTIGVGLIFGVSFGFGMPNCMGYFTQQTPVENRGRIGGLVFVLTGLLIVALDVVLINGTVTLVTGLAVLRGISLLAMPLVKDFKGPRPLEKPPSYRKMLSQRSYLLYFVPWTMFSLLNYLTTPVQESHLDATLFSNMQILQTVFIAIFALVGGVFMDKVGRKRLAITGFVLLGLSSSLVGLSQDITVWYFHSMMNGVSWGILCVLFVMTIWGDISCDGASDKYYALGASPFFISKMIEMMANSVIADRVDVTAVFSFSALFLFLAVLPLIYAPETLSEKIMKARELKTYLEKAQRIAVKLQKKDENAEKQKEESKEKDSDGGVEFEVKPEELECAEELAQKYY